MPTKMLDPNTTLIWAEQSAFLDPAAPSAAEINAALGKGIGTAGWARNFSVAIAAGYTLNPTDSDTRNSRSVADPGNGETRGAANYEGLIPFFREAKPSTNTYSEYLEAYDAFKTPGKWGYWLRRIGKTQDQSIVAGDLVSVFYFQSWEPRTETETGGGDIRFVVPFLKQGFVRTNVAVTNAS